MKHIVCSAVLIAVPWAHLQPLAAGEPTGGTAKVPKFELRDGDRVVLLGNTLVEREQKYGYWETMLTARWPERKITFRNLGWDGDTVWAESRGLFDPPEVGYKRMLEHVGRIKPTVIFLGYGNSEAFAGKGGLPRFITQYEKLLEDLKRVSAEDVRFVLVLPLDHEKLTPPLPDPSDYNRTLSLYKRAILEVAEEHGIPTMSPQLNARILSSIARTNVEPLPKFKLTDNGIHLTKTGYRITASHLKLQVDWLSQDARYAAVIAADSEGQITTRSGFSQVSTEPIDHGLRLHARRLDLCDPAWILLVRGLPDGMYTLTVDGEPVRTASAQDWTQSIEVNNGSDVDQFERLRQAVVEKNRLYFHSWRPQNVTYLFGFRKHEQGQNAKEVAEFEKLVAEKEKEIDRLKKPVTRTYELVRAGGD